MHKEEIDDLNRYNTQVSTELKIRKEEIKELKTTIKQYMDNDAKRVDKKCNVPQLTKIGTINNNINIHIKPLDTSQERFNTIVSDVYNYDMYKKGARGTVELLTSFFKQDGRIQAYCSDINRGYIKTIDPDFSEKLHTLSSLYEMCKNSNPLKNKKLDYYDQMFSELKDKLNNDVLALEQSLSHSTESFSEEKFKESYNKIKEKFYNIYKKMSKENLSENQSSIDSRLENTQAIESLIEDTYRVQENTSNVESYPVEVLNPPSENEIIAESN